MMMNTVKVVIALLLFLFISITKSYADSSCNNIAFTLSGFVEYYDLKEEILPYKIITIEEREDTYDDKNKRDNILSATEYIENNGVEKFIEASVNGQFPLIFQSDNEGILSTLDLAILNGANDAALNKIAYLDFSLSNFTFKILYSVSRNRIELLKTYQDKIDLTSLVFNHYQNKFNIINYTILEKDFKTLKYLMSDPDGPNVNDIYSGDLVDINELSFIEYPQLNQLIGTQTYKKRFNILKKKRLDVENELLEVVRKFNQFKLREVCSSDFNKANSIDVLFAISTDELNEQFKRLNVANIHNMALIDKKFDNPIYIEALVRMKERLIIDKYTLRKIKTVEEVIHSNTVIDLIGSFNLLKDEYDLIFNFDNKVNYETKNIRVSKLAHYITRNAKQILTDDKFALLIKNIALKNATNVRFGKNLAYYLFKYSDNIDLLSWYYDNVGKPQSDYGLNIMETLSMKSIYNKESFSKIKLLLSKGNSFEINSKLLATLSKNNYFLKFYNRLKNIKKGV